MKISFYSIDRAPRSLPIWQALITDLGEPHPKRIARVLGVSVRTVYRYNRTGDAPRSACLALFWLTRWGRSQVHSQAENDCRAAKSFAEALKAENRRLRTELAQVLALDEPNPATNRGGEDARLS